MSNKLRFEFMAVISYMTQIKLLNFFVPQPPGLYNRNNKSSSHGNMFWRLKELRHIIKRLVQGLMHTNHPIHIGVGVVLKHTTCVHTLRAPNELKSRHISLILVISTLAHQLNYFGILPTGFPDSSLVPLCCIPHHHLRIHDLESQFSPSKNGL